jgi:hypothetical protein
MADERNAREDDPDVQVLHADLVALRYITYFLVGGFVFGGIAAALRLMVVGPSLSRGEMADQLIYLGLGIPFGFLVALLLAWQIASVFFAVSLSRQIVALQQVGRPTGFELAKWAKSRWWFALAPTLRLVGKLNSRRFGLIWPLLRDGSVEASER